MFEDRTRQPDDGVYCRTAEEIAAACAEIQARWSDYDREKRKAKEFKHVPPLLHTYDTSPLRQRSIVLEEVD